MISEATLRLAVERAILDPGQLAALRALEEEQARASFEPVPDQERLRFISGFGDIFVVIGLGLFLGALGYFLIENANPLWLWGGLAAASWLLAEQFSRRRRMALPSIVLLAVFTAFVFLLFNLVFSWGLGFITTGQLPRSSLRVEDPAPVGLAALATLGMVALHYWRFRVPITIAAGIAALVLALYALLAVVFPSFARTAFTPFILLAGLAVFALAMTIDARDRLRETRKTDIAFWLHLLAAPMIVHSLIALAFGGVADLGIAKAIGLIGLFAALAIVALLIDRRAILVSSLVYAGFAFSRVFQTTGLANATIPASLLVLGSFILLLSTGWQPMRRGLLVLVPASLRRLLPPVLPGSSS